MTHWLFSFWLCRISFNVSVKILVRFMSIHCMRSRLVDIFDFVIDFFLYECIANMHTCVQNTHVENINLKFYMLHSHFYSFQLIGLGTSKNNANEKFEKYHSYRMYVYRTYIVRRFPKGEPKTIPIKLYSKLFDDAIHSEIMCNYLLHRYWNVCLRTMFIFAAFEWIYYNRIDVFKSCPVSNNSTLNR